MFPTCVGMNRKSAREVKIFFSVPHVRGTTARATPCRRQHLRADLLVLDEGHLPLERIDAERDRDNLTFYSKPN